MPLRDAKQYIESLRDGREVYIHGKRVEDVTKHPVLRRAIDHGAIDYELHKREGLHELFVTHSPTTGHEMRRYFEIPRSAEDLLRRRELIETGTMCGSAIILFMKEIGTDALNALAMIAPQMDKKNGTHYSERVAQYRDYVQEKDLSMSGAITDVKGDRSLLPSQQAMPYFYLKVVERQKDGVIVKGAKVHTTSAPITNELIALPTRAMTEADRDYCIGFAIPVNTKGVKIISRPELEDIGFFDYPITSGHLTLEAMTIFDEVFVPTERIFLDGEWEFAGIIANCFATWHRFTGISYKPPMADMLIGAAQLIADYNGVGRVSHVRDKITELIIFAETIRTFTKQAAHECIMTDNGIAFPNPLLSNMGKHFFATHYHDAIKAVQEIAGGLVVTGPTEADYENPATRDHIETFLAGRKGVKTEDRLRVMKLIRDLTATGYAGEGYVGTLHGEGSIEAQKISLYREYDIRRCSDYVKQVLKIE
jgi:4-hydroxybutyryl-CoA dehydratase / vinylacetyl-CoA-Delta-isomerase